MSAAVELIERSTRGLPRVEHDLLGVERVEEIPAHIERFVEMHLKSWIDHWLFYRTSVGSVYGLALADGRELVIKLHRPEIKRSYLEAIGQVQDYLRQTDFPAPKPLLAPQPLGRGWASCQSLIGGEDADPREAEVREEIARGLSQLVQLCLPLAADKRFEPWFSARDRLYPIPHDRRFDFEATGDGAEWIDAFARLAKNKQARGQGDLVLGHSDWRRQHLRFREGKLNAVYDWDSLVRLPEPVLVAGAMRTYTVDWSLDGQQYPSFDEMLQFLAAYESARGFDFAKDEIETIRSALVYGAAYTARCEHSDVRTGMGTREPGAIPEAVPKDSMRAFLVEHGEHLLGEPEELKAYPLPALSLL